MLHPSNAKINIEFSDVFTHIHKGSDGKIIIISRSLEIDSNSATRTVIVWSKFYHEILPDLKSKGKTVIVISHDDQYYHLADRLITLSSGNITTFSG